MPTIRPRVTPAYTIYAPGHRDPPLSANLADGPEAMLEAMLEAEP